MNLMKLTLLIKSRTKSKTSKTKSFLHLLVLHKMKMWLANNTANLAVEKIPLFVEKEWILTSYQWTLIFLPKILQQSCPVFEEQTSGKWTDKILVLCLFNTGIISVTFKKNKQHCFFSGWVIFPVSSNMKVKGSNSKSKLNTWFCQQLITYKFYN